VSEFDEYRHRYEDDINNAIAFGGKPHDFYTKVKADLLVELLKTKVTGPQPLNILDIGCGNGSIHSFLGASAFPIKITGVEVATQFVDMARQANPTVDYDVYDGHKLPYRSGQFDAAFTICVMHHVPPDQWPAFLLEMRRVVRPGGVVLVFEHNPINPLTSHIVKTCPLDKNAVLLSSGKLGSLMQSAGLEGVSREFILFTPFETSLFRRFDRLMRWLPLGAQYVSFGRVPS
jgi:ubiquinone/menaquinone biosynthesis C-methylase UbiE